MTTTVLENECARTCVKVNLVDRLSLSRTCLPPSTLSSLSDDSRTA
jgi:hypothetical protein